MKTLRIVLYVLKSTRMLACLLLTESCLAVFANETPLIITTCDLSAVSNLVEKIEASWPKDPGSYFQKMEQVCRELANSQKLPIEKYKLFQKCALNVLKKDDSLTGTQDSLYIKQNICIQLSEQSLVPLADRGTLNPVLFDAAKGLASMLRGLRKEIIPNFKLSPPPVINVFPPIRPKGEPVAAGMDPMAIKDPVARSAYQKAIEENSAKTRLLSRQRSLSDIEPILKERILDFFAYFMQHGATKEQMDVLVKDAVLSQEERQQLLKK
ncbi:MAG: hypothetical protein PHV34_22760 [Verrucomicrobiae bacterium]|nr:hypothetical protein [Verrucomicrobiae bacterium]